MKLIKQGALKFITYSAIGIFLFFCPFTMNGQKTILLDCIVSLLLNISGDHVKWFIFAAAIWGVVSAVRDKQYSKGAIDVFFFASKCFGILLCIIYILDIGPRVLFNSKLLPFLFNNICKSIIFLLPVGGVALVFLTEYGLMEFIGSFFERFMRRLWKIPGISTVDILTSFVGSFSLGFILTDKMYTAGRYSDKEATIIATGFSTVSTTFMITICRALDMMEKWMQFFAIAFIANMAVTFFVIRLWPIKNYKDTLEGRWKDSARKRTAFEQASERANCAGGLIHNMSKGLISGINMLGIMIPTILSVGTLGMLIVLYTPVFNSVAYVFFPFVWLFFRKDAMIISQALSTTIIDTFLPIPFIEGLSDQCKFFCGLVIVCEILFLTASIPALLATRIPVKAKDLLIIWAERMVFSIIIAGALTYFVFLIDC